MKITVDHENLVSSRTPLSSCHCCISPGADTSEDVKYGFGMLCVGTVRYAHGFEIPPWSENIRRQPDADGFDTRSMWTVPFGAARLRTRLSQLVVEHARWRG